MNGGVERDCNIDIFWAGGRFGQKFRAGKKGIFLEHSIFVPNADLLSHLHQGKAKRELASERIAIGPNVAEDCELVVASHYRR